MAAVSQPLHIFQKDVRHLWPETLTGIVLLAAFAWATPYGEAPSEYSVFAKALAVLLHVLIPLAWLIIISRLVQDEVLVGDRQFWTSRPYHWGSLLAAKLLYIVAFIYLPFFLMQVYLLHHAGLYPTTALGGLFHNLLLLTVILIVPITAIAAVTSTLPRLLLSFLGALLYLVVAAVVVLRLFLHSMPPPHFDILLMVVVTLVPALALVYQYARRRTAISRGMLLATPLIVVLLLLITPATALIRGGFPVASGPNAPRLTPVAIAVNPAEPPPAGKLDTRSGGAEVFLPVRAENLSTDDLYVVSGTAGSIHQDGTNWDSSYHGTFGSVQIGGGNPQTLLPVSMPEGIFNQVRSKPTDLKVSLPAEHLKAAPVSTWKATLLPFSVPGHGRCSYPADDSAEAGIQCRFAFGPPKYTSMVAQVSPRSCTSPAGSAVPGFVSLSSLGGSFLDFNPVYTTDRLKFQTGDPNPQHNYELCQGTPLDFHSGESVGKVRLELTEKGIVLDRYAARIRPRAEAAGQAIPAQPAAGETP